MASDTQAEWRASSAGPFSGGRAPAGSEGFYRRGGATAAAFVAASIAAPAGGQWLGPIFVLAGLVGGVRRTHLVALRGAVLRGGLAMLFFALFWIWLGASWFWTPQHDPATALAALFYLPALLLFAWTAGGNNDADRDLILRAGVAFVFVTAILAAQEGLFGFPFYTAERGALDTFVKLTNARHSLGGAGAALAVILWPAVAILDRKGGAAHLILLIPIALAVVIGRCAHTSAVIAAVLVGAFCYLAARAYPRAMILISGFAIADYLLIAPQFAKLLKVIPEPVLSMLPPSYMHRVEIWQNAATLIDVKPLLGWGIDASKMFTQDYLYAGIGLGALIPRHPHNAALQLWLETGLVGVGLLAAAILALTLSLLKSLSHDRVATAGAVGAIGSFCVFAGVSFGIWQAWFLSAGFAAAGLVTAQIMRRGVKV